MDSLALKFTHFTLTSRNRSWASANGSKATSSCTFSRVFPFSCAQRLRFRGNSTIMAAAKKENKNINKRKNEHSFYPRPDESTGTFPEAVLLKEKKVEENGRLMPEFADEEERELYEALTLTLESDLKLDEMRHYEVVYLIHEDHEEEVENVNNKVQEFLKEKNGKLWRFSDWGMRSLAYPIKKADNAHYILMNFELEAKSINEFKSMLDKDERVIRHLVMKQDKAETEECLPPPEYHTLYGDEDAEDEDEDDEEDDDDDDEDDDDEDYDDEDEDDEDDEDEDYDDEEDYDDDEDDDEDYDDEGEMDGEDEGIIYVDDDVDEEDEREKGSNKFASKKREVQPEEDKREKESKNFANKKREAEPVSTVIP
ncbi:30S ribosomal protein S6 [Striga asiatica]|uniref:30S ribosomal protein S6 n=1 Tax=Striga asiatica TaxID=4170 RepID=A0A5A7PWI6_STRAF|nr:30S ribosomal protein S6 [Striga asiatica]